MMTTMMNPMTSRLAGMMNPAAPSAEMNPMMNLAMAPRCVKKLEKCTGGMKITCVCDDQLACKTLQNMCASMTGAMCSVCCVMNGMMVCCCNLTMCLCKCEMTKDGVCLTCTSGDKACCDMVQACCDCVNCCKTSGCSCCLMMNGMPVCCC